jgi:YebC/PmpR family DNA-binding regulatory protein
MSGHSKWATIKHKKGALDAKRGKLFSKLARLIIVAARKGGGDPAMNLHLRYAIDKAKAACMTKDTIERAVKKGTGELEGANYESTMYEGYGPGGVALMIDILTDNRNRTAPEIRRIMENRGAALGSTNCVAWMFQTKGVFMVDASKISEDKLMEIVLEAGAEDLQAQENSFQITCPVNAFDLVRKALDKAGIAPDLAEVQHVPTQTVKVDGHKARQVIALINDLEDNDDVQNVYANFDIDEKVMQEIAAEA